MVQELDETETYCGVSVDIGGIERLLDLSTAALRDKGIVRTRYSLERTSALYLLALCMLRAQDRRVAIPCFLEAALPLLASSQMEQDVLSQRYRQQDRSNILQGIFCVIGEAGAKDEALLQGLRPAPEAMPGPAGLADAGDAALETAPSGARHAGKIRQLRRRLSSKRSAKLLRRHVSLRAARYALSLPAIRVGPHASRRESARNASFRLPILTKKLHAEKTINATVQKAGYFTPVWRTKLETNEYLFLVRQLSRTDFEYQRIRAQVLDLYEYGIFLNMYSYNEDPRVLWDALSNEHGDHLRLEQLHQRHPDARLVLVSEGHELLNRLTYTPLSVTGELTLWPRRALITPVPSADWGDIEGVIHYDLGFSIASSRENAFSNLDQLFGGKGTGPVALDSNDLRAAVTPEFVANPSLQYVEDADPPPQEQDRLVFELKLYLETTGFLWLAACAFFPVTTPAIAKFFASKLDIADSEGTIFARLCVLPWMRFGHMPRWLRKRLDQALTESERSRARRAAASLLAAENLVEKEGAEFFPGDEPAFGGENLTLPLRIDLQDGGETEIDELGIEFLSAGSREDIDPVLRVSSELHTQLLKAIATNSVKANGILRSPRPSLNLRRVETAAFPRGGALDSSDLGKALPTDTGINFMEEYFNILASNASTVSYLHQQAGNTTHFNIISIKSSYIVEADGKTLVTRTFTVSSCTNRALPFNMWIEGDGESDPIHGFRLLNITITDKKSGQNLGMLATEDKPRKKRFGIILSEFEHQEQKEFEVRYRWPGYMRRILEKGSTDFYWNYRTTSPNYRGSITYDWLFLKGFPQVTLELKGDHGKATLTCRSLKEGQRWTYHDPAAIMDGRKYVVSVRRVQS